MYCMKCGAELPDNADFCPLCGTKVKYRPKPGTAAPKTPENNHQSSKPVTPEVSGFASQHATPESSGFTSQKAAPESSGFASQHAAPESNSYAPHNATPGLTTPSPHKAPTPPWLPILAAAMAALALLIGIGTFVLMRQNKINNTILDNGAETYPFVDNNEVSPEGGSNNEVSPDVGSNNSGSPDGDTNQDTDLSEGSAAEDPAKTNTVSDGHHHEVGGATFYTEHDLNQWLVPNERNPEYLNFDIGQMLIDLWCQDGGGIFENKVGFSYVKKGEYDAKGVWFQVPDSDSENIFHRVNIMIARNGTEYTNSITIYEYPKPFKDHADEYYNIMDQYYHSIHRDLAPLILYTIEQMEIDPSHDPLSDLNLNENFLIT